MYYLSHAVAVNPPGAEPVLTREQVWNGLVEKVLDAKKFVTGMSQCDVIERKDNVILREITFNGMQSRELITLHEPVKCQFVRQDGTGWIDNVLSDFGGELILTFTFGLRFPGIEDGSPDEQSHGDKVRGAYVGAVASTIDQARQLVIDGKV
jgi:Domain of unknown function (DUF1857)